MPFEAPPSQSSTHRVFVSRALGAIEAARMNDTGQRPPLQYRSRR